MILIAHRGNINGKNPELENSITYINEAIKLEYNVEVDVWMINGVLFLGHDKPQYKITLHWLDENIDYLWVHCKNLQAIEWFNITNQYNYFWHQEDTVTLTSKGYIWAYPGNQPIKKSIAVLPELNNENVYECLGICSDYIQEYKNFLKI
jgi:hypothetical protein